jgi:hypothetical protein
MIFTSIFDLYRIYSTYVESVNKKICVGEIFVTVQTLWVWRGVLLGEMQGNDSCYAG